MKKYLVVTGGAGFVGCNLIKLLLEKTKHKIISLDNYSTGSTKNHLKSKRLKYLKGNTINTKSILKKYEKEIETIFHFGEFSRIFQSFKYFNQCYETNSSGSKEVFNFCLNNKIKLIYSATSASLGKKGRDKNLSPYAFTKSKNIELLENLKKWFNLKFEVIYFYNVYGEKQIMKGEMATVIGIFQNQYANNMPLTVVKPGTQKRRFTHITDTVYVCFKAWKSNKCGYHSITNKKSYSILEVARMFNSKIKYLPHRLGERYTSALSNKIFDKKITKYYGKINLKDYISSFIKSEINKNENC